MSTLPIPEGKQAVVDDFQAGPGGDQIDLEAMQLYLDPSLVDDNLFIMGVVRLQADGANTLVQYKNGAVEEPQLSGIYG